MVILALGFTAFSANAQNVKEVRKQGLAKKMKTHKTLEATPQLSKQTTTTATSTTELKAKPSGKAVVLKPRPNATKKVTQAKPVTVTKKSSLKAAQKPASQKFKVDREKRAAKFAQRMSNREIDKDKNVGKKRIKKLQSNQ